MGWNNNWNNNRRNNGGYGRDNYDDRRGNYNDRGGYRGGFDDGPRNNFRFSVGQKCYLKDYPDTVVSVVRVGREQYECRLPNLSTQWFYEHELEAIDMKD